MQRMLDPKFQLSAEDTAKFVAKLTDLPLVTKIEDMEIDEKLVEVVGDAIIRARAFSRTRAWPNSVAVLMANPLDYAKREAFQQATELIIDEVRVAAATCHRGPRQEVLQGPRPRRPARRATWTSAPWPRSSARLQADPRAAR
jgi:hypothetical protein